MYLVKVSHRGLSGRVIGDAAIDVAPGIKLADGPMEHGGIGQVVGSNIAVTIQVLESALIKKRLALYPTNCATHSIASGP